MQRRVKQFNPGDFGRIDDALAHLRQARDLLSGVKAPRAAERVRLAIRSAEGARRNIGYRHTHSIIEPKNRGQVTK